MRPITWCFSLILLASSSFAAESGPRSNPIVFSSLYRVSQAMIKPMTCTQVFKYAFEIRDEHLELTQSSLENLLPANSVSADLKPGAPNVTVLGEDLSNLTEGATLAERLLGIKYDLKNSQNLDSLVFSAKGQEQVLALAQILDEKYRYFDDHFQTALNNINNAKRDSVEHSLKVSTVLNISGAVLGGALLLNGYAFESQALSVLGLLGLSIPLKHYATKLLDLVVNSLQSIIRPKPTNQPTAFSEDQFINEALQKLMQQTDQPVPEHNKLYTISDSYETNSLIADKLLRSKPICISDARVLCVFETTTKKDLRIDYPDLTMSSGDSRSDLIAARQQGQALTVREVLANATGQRTRKIYRDLLFFYDADGEPSLHIILRSPLAGRQLHYLDGDQ